MSDTKLFADWIAETKKLQIEAYGQDPTLLTGEDRVEYIKWNVLAAIDELMEMLGEVGWKNWATSRHVNEDAAGGEMIDLLHFASNLLLALHWDDEKLNTAYLAKMSKNRTRMASGTYDGVSGKCPICRRALDDENTKCTETECANE